MPEGSFVAANVTSHGPLIAYLGGGQEESDAQVIFVQEHHALNYKLAEVQAPADDLGWQGAWLADEATEGGSSAGAA